MLPSEDLTAEDRWQAWAAAYVALCQRVVNEALPRPGVAAASSAATLSNYIGLLRDLGAIEPRLPGVLLPDA